MARAPMPLAISRPALPTPPRCLDQNVRPRLESHPLAETTPGGVASQGKCRRLLKVHPRVRPWRSVVPSWDKGRWQRLRCWTGRRFARTTVRSIRNAVRRVGGGSSAVGSSCPPNDHPPTPGLERQWHDLRARGSPSWLGARSVLPGRHLGPSTRAPRTSALTDAQPVTPYRLFRSISLGGVRRSSSPARYKLHSPAARGAVRGSSNKGLELTASRSTVVYCFVPSRGPLGRRRLVPGRPTAAHTPNRWADTKGRRSNAEIVQGTRNALATLLQDVGVDHGGGHIVVPE